MGCSFAVKEEKVISPTCKKERVSMLVGNLKS